MIEQSYRTYRGFRFRVRLVRSAAQTVDQVSSPGSVFFLERLPKLGPVARLERYEPHDRMFGRFSVRSGHEEPERREPFGRRRVRAVHRLSSARQRGQHRRQRLRDEIHTIITVHTIYYCPCGKHIICFNDDW